MQLTVCGSPRPRSSGWRVEAMGDYPAPGGEPLWRSSLHPREFRRNTTLAETRKNRRLPRTTQRFAGLRPDGCKRIGAAGKSSRWVIRGSRLLRHFVVGLSAERNTARSPWYVPKRLPSRALGNRALHSRATSFEIEDENDKNRQPLTSQHS
jgi:hypothetical protein